ncbi:HNH endonuclease [Anaerosacchariphilus polymeriproducens]|uniref:Putative HNH nuclease YajD n=1 Tax=Anaerosacchariphilus polymeriproducens TaxID=1812858 RepID=A0A371AT85_9FIRM|nr:HNH endonuclease [Anaerosacchariphilus polymeriproducens]RDU22771.1 HNH endonuclease [Anaerosacchariphilus polymeriproducens]
MARLKSCPYCNRIHASDYICPEKAAKIKERQSKYKTTSKDKFRWSNAWQKKREQIKDRDNHLCVVCRQENRYTYNNLSVHHIEPLEESYDLRLDDDNLITLCDMHHEQAEKGEISKEYLKELIKRE